MILLTELDSNFQSIIEVLSINTKIEKLIEMHVLVDLESPQLNKLTRLYTNMYFYNIAINPNINLDLILSKLSLENIPAENKFVSNLNVNKNYSAYYQIIRSVHTFYAIDTLTQLETFSRVFLSKIPINLPQSEFINSKEFANYLTKYNGDRLISSKIGLQTEYMSDLQLSTDLTNELHQEFNFRCSATDIEKALKKTLINSENTPVIELIYDFLDDVDTEIIVKPNLSLDKVIDFDLISKEIKPILRTPNTTSLTASTGFFDYLNGNLEDLEKTEKAIVKTEEEKVEEIVENIEEVSEKTEKAIVKTEEEIVNLEEIIEDFEKSIVSGGEKMIENNEKAIVNFKEEIVNHENFVYVPLEPLETSDLIIKDSDDTLFYSNDSELESELESESTENTNSWGDFFFNIFTFNYNPINPIRFFYNNFLLGAQRILNFFNFWS